MKATLSFDLSDPDDRKRHLQCVKSQDMAIALSKLKDITYREYTRHDYNEAVLDILADFDLKELT